MEFFRLFCEILQGRFPGEFDCKPGMRGRASGLEIRRAGRPGFAFVFPPTVYTPPEPDRPPTHLLGLWESDDSESGEYWSTTRPDECVERLLPWGFPPEWRQPDPLDRAKQKRLLAKIAEGISARNRISCRVDDLDPILLARLNDEEREALERDLRALNTARLKRHFPWDASGRLALKTTVLLATYPSQSIKGRIVSLAAVAPFQRKEEQAIRVGLVPLIPINQTHRWPDHPWLWQNVESPPLLGISHPGATESREAISLRMLEQGQIEDALSLYGVTLSDDLHRLLGGQRIEPPACCAHTDATWTDLLVQTFRQASPWLLPTAAASESAAIRRLIAKKTPKKVLSWKLAIFPGQVHARKASLMLTSDRDGQNPRFSLEATGGNARISDTAWKRPVEVDFARFGIPLPGTEIVRP